MMPESQVLRLDPRVHTLGELSLAPVNLPEVVQNSLRMYPQLTPLLAEAAAYDPKTFLHCVMVAHEYQLLRTAYIESIKSITPLHELSSLDAHLRSFDTAVLWHDAGKWVIDPDPAKSSQIINFTPEPHEETSKGGIAYVDSRSADMKALHEIHPLAGGLWLQMLKDPPYNLPEDEIARCAYIAFTHHEQVPQTSRTADGEGRIIFSYPRNNLRNKNPYDTLALLFIQLADNAVATGQPRVYRGYRHSEEIVRKVLLAVINQRLLETICGPLDPIRLGKIRWNLCVMTMTSLGKIQKIYPEEVCHNPQGFLLNGQLLLPDPFMGGPNLGDINHRLWNGHRRRIEGAIELLKKN